MYNVVIDSVTCMELTYIPYPTLCGVWVGLDETSVDLCSYSVVGRLTHLLFTG